MNDAINFNKFRDFAEKNVAPQSQKAQTLHVVFLPTKEKTIKMERPQLDDDGNEVKVNGEVVTEWVDVPQITDASLISKYVSIEFQALEYAVQKLHGTLGFSEEELLLYCKTLVYARIAWVVGGKLIIHPTEHIMVPAFLMNIIMQIGIVQDSGLGITILPEGVPEDFVPMDKERMRAISMRLESISSYEGGFGFPRDKSGSWDFMTMQLIENTVCRYDAKAHPVYALMAAVIGPKLIESVLSPLVTYGDSGMLEGLLWQLTSI